MIRDVVTRETTLDDWMRMRGRIVERITAAMGEMPLHEFSGRYTVTGRYSANDLLIEEISFEVLPGYVCHGAIVRASERETPHTCPGAVCIHGSEAPEQGYRSLMDPVGRPRRTYVMELARRGFVTVAVDQFGFGEWIKETTDTDVYDAFYEAFPGWSLDGMRLLIQRSAVDVLARHPLVDKDRIAAIGNSLGGKSAILLAALDERIKAAAPSCGVSPIITNIYRNLPGHPRRRNNPVLGGELARNGKPLFEYSEVMALVAPRGLLVVEPWNDPYNPYIETVLDCGAKARFVYELYGKPENLTVLCHGRGHDTPDEFREFAYQLLAFYLK